MSSEQRSDFWGRAAKEALKGGFVGMAAMVCQVLSLMWLRTIVNYQYRYGTSLAATLSTLYQAGGVRRFYRGVGPALLQAPIARFGDTAANSGMLFLLNNSKLTEQLPSPLKSAVVSCTAALFRIFIMPIDTLKTHLQVDGINGMSILRAKLSQQGPGVLYHGSTAAFTATLVGHYPWFLTFNELSRRLPKVPREETLRYLGRSAFIGLCASIISDVASNAFRVVKTLKQTSAERVSYRGLVAGVVGSSGVGGLMTRGLRAKLLANGLQGLMFSVLWRVMTDAISQ